MTVLIVDDNGGFRAWARVLLEPAGYTVAGEATVLSDRVAALDGHFEVDSPPGAGTRLRAELPCE